MPDQSGFILCGINLKYVPKRSLLLIKITSSTFNQIAPGLNQYFNYFSPQENSSGIYFRFFNQVVTEVINLYEQTLLGALSDTPKLADNITLLLTF